MCGLISKEALGTSWGHYGFANTVSKGFPFYFQNFMAFKEKKTFKQIKWWGHCVFKTMTKVRRQDGKTRTDIQII